jgi:phosphate-selective porin OprO/OprP
MKQKHITIPLLAAGILTSCIVAAKVHGQTSDPALNALIKKGILTEQEAKAALAEQEEQARKAKPPESDVRVFWKDGLNFESADKKFKSKLGGRIDIGVAGFSESDEVRSIPSIGDIPAGVELRRARLSLEGEYAFSAPAFYKLEVDFGAAARDAADSKFALKDVYLGLRKVPVVGTIQAGHFKEPIGLELLTSGRYLTFIERASPIEALAPERNTGLMLANQAFDERLTWAVGTFTDVGDSASGTLDSDFRVDGRISGLPWYDPEAKGSRYLHLGVSGSYIKPQNESAQYRSRPEAHLAPRFVDTGLFTADNAYLFGAEAALVYGPFSLQGEYLQTWVDRPAADTASLQGYYVFGSWFLTGEHRAYRRSDGTFDRLRPKQNFSFTGGGLGAWEVAARYSHLDLDDSGIQGGKLDDITGGLNWYLNPNMKIQFNYIYSMLDRTVSGSNHDGHAHIFQMLLHIDF